MKNVASLNLSVNSFPLAWEIQINTSPGAEAGDNLVSGLAWLPARRRRAYLRRPPARRGPRRSYIERVFTFLYKSAVTIGYRRNGAHEFMLGPYTQNEDLGLPQKTLETEFYVVDLSTDSPDRATWRGGR